jgi:hypothetical protein
MPPKRSPEIRTEPTRWRPQFLKDIQARTERDGITYATYQTLKQAGVTVSVTGDYGQLKDHKDGMLFVGDHRRQWEFVALASLLHTLGRNDMRNIAKFYVKPQVTAMLGRAAAENIIPVYPRLLASDRSGNYGNERLSRLQYKKWLLTTTESGTANSTALRRAADYLADSGVVNIFPCGSVVDACTHPWRQGVGRIIQQLPEDTRDTVLVVPYRVADISWTRLVAAVALSGRGPIARPQTLTFEVAPMQTAGEIMAAASGTSPADSAGITEHIRQNFLAAFVSEECD